MTAARVRAVVAGALLCIGAVPAHSQIAGRVSAEDGRPLVGATVELWHGKRMVVSTLAGTAGVFTLRDTLADASGPRAVIARMIGYRPLVKPIGTDAGQLALTLVRLPSVLETVSVNADAGRPKAPCSRTPSAIASQLFARAASFYRDDTRWLDRMARYAQLIRSTDAERREQFMGVPQRGGWTRIAGFYEGAAAINATAVPRRFTADQRHALPFPVPEVSRDGHGRIGAVFYPHFWEWGAPSFVSAGFVDSMPKAVVTQGPRGSVISFCPARRRAPYTYGEIELAPDTTIVAVRWRFDLGSSGPEAGGAALFASPSTKSSRSHLLPSSSLVWSRLPASDRYEVTEYAFGPWIVAEMGERLPVLSPIPPG